jgi:hypothetical protein
MTVLLVGASVRRVGIANQGYVMGGLVGMDGDAKLLLNDPRVRCVPRQINSAIAKCRPVLVGVLLRNCGAVSPPSRQEAFTTFSLLLPARFFSRSAKLSWRAGHEFGQRRVEAGFDLR